MTWGERIENAVTHYVMNHTRYELDGKKHREMYNELWNRVNSAVIHEIDKWTKEKTEVAHGQ